jgi:hypothetical protein
MEQPASIQYQQDGKDKGTTAMPDHAIAGIGEESDNVPRFLPAALP